MIGSPTARDGIAIRPYTAGCGAWRSLVARLLWEQEVAGSNPAAPIVVRP